MAWYRLKVDWTYSTSASATTAQTAINTTLTNSGRAEQAAKTGNTVTVIIEPVTTMDEAVTLRNALLANWNTGTRTAGKASVVARDESSL